jgi:predicted MFS family arabinose efflux permease
VVERRRIAGSGITLQQGVAFATLVQFAAQMAGLWLGGMATSAGVWPLLFVQSAILAAGAVSAWFMSRGRKVRPAAADRRPMIRDILDGVAVVRRDPVLLTMCVSMFGVGVFVIGAFLVILPIVNADVYGHNSGGLRDIFITFWGGAFCSSAALTRFRRIRHPGRLLLVAQLGGSLGILIMLGEAPYWAFLSLVFIWGLASGVSIMMSRTIVQAAAPPEALARVLSIYQLGFMGGAPIGSAMMGVLADQLGPRLVVLVPSLGMVAMIAWISLRTPIWSLSPGAAKAPGKG